MTGGNFFLHSIDRDRRSVCMFSTNFFTASGLLVDIFDGVFDRNLEKLQSLRDSRVALHASTTSTRSVDTLVGSHGK